MDREQIILRCSHAAYKMRKNALKMSLTAGKNGAHLGGGLSMIEIMATLYMGVMNYKKSDLHWEERDRFILSKGHGVLALYTALEQAGILAEHELLEFKSNKTFLTGHPTMNIDKGIEFSSGSLGQGLSLGVGTCLALRRKGNTKSKCYVLLGDGECNEGSVWEAAMCAKQYNLNRLVAVIDSNKLQYDGETSEIMGMDNMKMRWEAFGWKALEVDGHDIGQLYDALTYASDKPLVVIADTVKGKGISFMENNPVWHHAVLTQRQYEQAMNELEEKNGI